MPSSETLPIEALPGWARLNGLEFLNCKLDQTEDKGIGLVATSELSLAAGDAGLDDDKPLLKVPRDVVLGADTIEDFAKVDQNFRQLLDVAGKQVRIHGCPTAFTACFTDPFTDTEGGHSGLHVSPPCQHATWPRSHKVLPSST